MSYAKDRQTAHRRALLKAAAGCGMMTNTSLLATMLNLQATKAMASGNSGTGGYKALVCLFLFGGNDSWNMLTPYDGTGSGDLGDPANAGAFTGEYGDYQKVRGGHEYEEGGNTINDGGLALQKDDDPALSELLPIVDQNGRGFGIHNGMPEIQSLYNAGNLAFVSNVGSLNRWITRSEYNSNALEARPVGLFSHSDHQRHWMTGVPNTRTQVTGWGGKMADLLRDTNSNPAVSMNISTNGVNLFQSGDVVVPYSIGSGYNSTNPANAPLLGNNPATQVSGYFADDSQTGNIANKIFSRNMDSFLGQTYGNLLAQSMANTTRGSVDAAIDFNAAVNDVVFENTSFDNQDLSRRLRVIAKVIGAQSQLGQQRQVFFVSIGGWDNHSNLITAHNTNLPRVSRAVGSFYNAMVELGVQNDVTLFTASDFARTLGTNGQGSDHAWGSNHFVVGGCVDGGKVYGEYPNSLLNPVDTGAAATADSPERPAAGNINLGRGRMIPTMSVDQMSAELAMWFGVSNSDLPTILPQIRQFYNANATGTPLNLFLPTPPA